MPPRSRSPFMRTYLDDSVACVVGGEAAGAEGVGAGAVGAEEVAAVVPRRADRWVLGTRLEELGLQQRGQPRRWGARGVETGHLLQANHGSMAAN